MPKLSFYQVTICLLAVFFIGTRLLAHQNPSSQSATAQISNNISENLKLSPKSKVTVLVTPKTIVTNISVTMSPIVSPIFYPLQSPNSQIASTPTPTRTMVTPIANPTPIRSPSISPTVSPINSPTPSPTSTETPAETAGVVINEIAWMGTQASSNDEWLELYNVGSGEVSLDGWTLAARDGTPSINLSGNIGPHQFYVLKRTADDVLPDVSTGQIYTGALGNSGEYLELKDASGTIKDAVDATAGWPAGENPSGNPQDRVTMERVNPAVSGTVASNWKSNDKITRNGHDSAGNAVNGTPGSGNSVSSF